MLTVNTFPDGRRHITGNRCERGLGKQADGQKGPNIFAYKLKRMFDYTPLEQERAPVLVQALQRVLPQVHQ